MTILAPRAAEWAAVAAVVVVAGAAAAAAAEAIPWLWHAGYWSK